MDTGIELYRNDKGDRVTAYKIYVREDVQYKVRLVLTDKNNNSINKVFGLTELYETWGEKKIKRAFIGRGEKPLSTVDIDEIYRAFLDRVINMPTTIVGQSSYVTLQSMRKQLAYWYNEALEKENGLSRMIVTLEDDSKYDLIYESMLDVNSDVYDKEGNRIDKDNIKHIKSKEPKEDTESKEVKEAIDTMIIGAGKINHEKVLLISCPEFKKWILWSGYQPTIFLKKMVKYGILYTPNTSVNPRYHFSSKSGWYRAIYIDKLDLMNQMG